MILRRCVQVYFLLKRYAAVLLAGHEVNTIRQSSNLINPKLRFGGYASQFKHYNQWRVNEERRPTVYNGVEFVGDKFGDVNQLALQFYFGAHTESHGIDAPKRIVVRLQDIQTIAHQFINSICDHGLTVLAEVEQIGVQKRPSVRQFAVIVPHDAQVFKCTIPHLHDSMISPYAEVCV